MSSETSPSNGERRPLRKWILAAMLIAGGIGLATLLPAREITERILQTVERAGYWGPVLIGVAYIPATILFIPGSLLTLGAGALFGIVQATIAISIGSTLGSTATFLIARYFARDWVARKLADRPRFAALDRAVGRQGFRIVLLTRLSPVFPYNLLGYAYGITDVRLRDYVLASWIGMLPGTVLYVYLGSIAGSVARVAAGERRETSIGQWVLYGVGFIATMAVTILITRLARRAMNDALPMNPPTADNTTEAS